MGEVDRDFWGYGVGIILRMRKTLAGTLRGKGMGVEIGTLPPVDIFPSQSPPLFQARKGTA